MVVMDGCLIGFVDGLMLLGDGLIFGIFYMLGGYFYAPIPVGVGGLLDFWEALF